MISAFLTFNGCNTTDNNKNSSTPAEKQDSNKKPPILSQSTIKSTVPHEYNFPDLNRELGGHDTCEGFNRSMFAVNKYGGKYVMQPLAIFWGSLIPRHGIDCFNRFTDNVAFPKRTFSSLCQAKFKGAGIDFSRFLINVTVGIAGFYDPATHWFDLEYQDEDFGQAFAVWGFGPGANLHLPSIGPTNVRDGIGKIFDYAFDPKTYITGGQGFTILNEGTARYREFDSFLRANYDPYELAKRLYYAERYVKINDFDYKANLAEYQKKLLENAKNIPDDLDTPNPVTPGLNPLAVAGFKSQGPAVDTLRTGQVKIQYDEESMWVDVSAWNTDFFNQGSIRSVTVIEDHPDLDYKVWYQDDRNAPLAIIMPGTGGYFTGTDVTRLAEIMYGKGYSAVIIPSAMNWSFMVSAATTPVPGYTPNDADDVRNAIAAIVKDLETNKNRKFPAKLLMGYSMGGLHTAFIGALEKKQPKLNIDRYVSINPPVNLVHAISQIDEFSLAWKKWQRNMVFERGTIAASKFIGVTRKPYAPFDDTGIDDPVEESTPVSAPQSDASSNGGKEQKKEVAKDKKKDDPNLPFTNTEAQVLIGYSFKIILNEMVLTTVRTHPELKPAKLTCSWGNRTDFYREINDLSFMDYVKTYVIKYYSDKEKRPVSLAELNDKSSLPAIAEYLREDKEIFVIHTSNDFLENDQERLWLQSTMGDRCTYYSAGGHIGDLYFKSVQDRIGKLAEDLKKEKATPAAGK